MKPFSILSMAGYPALSCKVRSVGTSRLKAVGCYVPGDPVKLHPTDVVKALRKYGSEASGPVRSTSVAFWHPRMQMGFDVSFLRK